MIAIRDNYIAAQSLGINVLRMRLLAFCVSAFFTAVAGSLWAHFIQSFSPKAFLFVETFNIITMLIVGGMGSISGSVIGAVGITIFSEVLRNAERGVNLGFVQIPPVYGASQILMAVIFILLIIFRPEGIMGKRELDFGRLFSFSIQADEKKGGSISIGIESTELSWSVLAQNNQNVQKRIRREGVQDEKKHPHISFSGYRHFCSPRARGVHKPAANTPIKIGVIYNVTGAQASLDVPSYNGAKLAAKEINAAGGVLGRQIQIVFYDGKSDATVIGNAATQLVETDKVVAMMGFSDSDMTLAAAPIAAKAGIVFVTSGATSPKLPDQVPDYLFLACFGDNVQAAAGAEYAFNTLNYKSVYLLTDQGHRIHQAAQQILQRALY